MSTETKKRTILKTITSKIGEILISATIVQVLFGQVFLTIGLPILLEVIQMGYYVLHERLWAKVKWGELRDCDECRYLKVFRVRGDKT